MNRADILNKQREDNYRSATLNDKLDRIIHLLERRGSPTYPVVKKLDRIIHLLDIQEEEG